MSGLLDLGRGSGAIVTSYYEIGAFVGPSMTLLTRLLVVGLLALTGCASNETSRMREMPLEDIAKSFRGCTGPFGVHRDVYRLSLDEAPEIRGEVVTLSDSGLVSDGFSHMLIVDRSRSVAYIQETGGLAGVLRFYGPITLDAACVKASGAVGAPMGFHGCRCSLATSLLRIASNPRSSRPPSAAAQLRR